jgi:F0F1-type ATP synthase membrane subunit b/b'
MPDVTIMNPFLQYGFAGFAVLLLWLVYWLTKNLLKVLKDTNRVIQNNTLIAQGVQDTAKETRELMIEIKDQLLSRPCLLRNRNGETMARDT